MSTATRSGGQSPARHGADSHDLIRVHGARVNNLKDVSVEIPKRRLTVFTGVSGSGKSSLVFDTIAAESQRLINETYSAFVQGFMPTLARPDVDLLEGLTTAIIVDQERMGANPRSTVGTATDANAMLRILFSRLGQPHIGPPTAFSFNVPTRKASGVMSTEKAAAGSRRTSSATSVYQGGMCPRCEGMGSVSDFDLTALYDESKSLSEGGLTGPRLQHGRLVRPHLQRHRPRPGQADRQVHQEGDGRPPLQGADQDQGRGHQPHLRGRDPEDPEVDALQGRRRDAAAHPRLRRAGHHLPRPAPSATGTRLSAEARSSKIEGKNIADLCAMQISDLADWVRALDEPSVAPLLDGPAAPARLVRRDRAGLPLPRPAGRHAVRRRGAAHQDDPAPRARRSPTSPTSSTSRRSACTRTTSSG